MKAALLLGLLVSHSLASARIHSSTHALAVAACLISRPLAALAVPVWTPSSSRIGPRLANSTSTAARGTYTVVLGDTINSIAAAAGTTTQNLEDANPSIVPTHLQVGQVLNLPVSASSNANSSSTNEISSAGMGTSMSENTPAATHSNTSNVGGEDNTGSSAANTGTSQQNSTSTCGSHHHHQNGTAGANAQDQNGNSSTGHHSHNGTTTNNHKNNSTLSTNGSGGCTGHHHHNGTAAGTQTAASFFIPATATASALAVALTSSAATAKVGARALGGFLV